MFWWKMAHVEQRLCEEVRRHKHLYDPSSPDYKDRHMAANSWNEISKNIGLDVSECMRRWKNVRDKYVRLRKKLISRSGDPCSKRVPSLYIRLSWLEKYVKHRCDDGSLDEQQASGGGFCSVLPSVRHVASQTDPPETKPETAPQTRTVGTQLSIKTLQNAFRSTATQAKVPSRDCGVCTLTFPLDSPILFLQPTIVKRPSKRPRLSLKEEEEDPSESSLTVVENST
ncbi:uncharacterized protein LOC125016739 isoform X1 [Mugil cephalus]|uniref:uncharacterized protein LOC125016739 isoform X1 n=1 Tax=Mugil cephalus TaxID=48193 RepID=UPI001FB626A7|nr:uncharacterized protein LOC125016739 isoform X1 [Mugil cephalus]